MGKLDKKVLKVLKTRQFEDLDAEDIAMQFKGDEDDVKEALGSLKDLGFVESVTRDGKTFWKLSADEPVEKPMKEEKFEESIPIDSDTVSFDISTLNQQPAAKKEPVLKKENPETTIDFFSVSDKVEPSMPLPRAPEPVKINPEIPVAPRPEPTKVKIEIPVAPKPVEIKMEIPVLPKPEPVKVKAEIPITPSASAAKHEVKPGKEYDHKDYMHDDDDDETDKNIRPPRKASAFPFIGIAVAVVFSVVISAVIAMMVASNASKEVSGGLGELEKKVSEAKAKQDQRIESILQKVNTIAEKPAAAQPKTKQPAASRSVKPAPVKSVKQMPKRTPITRKKRSKSPSSDQESASPPSTGESSSAAQSSPSPEPAPAAETPTPTPAQEPDAATPAAPAEGSGQ